MVRGLCEGVKLDVHFPGFPSLKHIPHTGTLEKKGVRVFQAASRGENFFLTVTPREAPKVSYELDTFLEVSSHDWSILRDCICTAAHIGGERQGHACSASLVALPMH